jgi:hypothetical protein
MENPSTTRTLTNGFGRKSRASRCRQVGHQRAERSSPIQSWMVCITIILGARMKGHHVSVAPDGWGYSARTTRAKALLQNINQR